jgi:IS4 transposase
MEMDSDLNIGVTENAAELKIIVSLNKPNETQPLYKRRWQIESAVKALKTCSLNIEDTSLTDIERVSKFCPHTVNIFMLIYKPSTCSKGDNFLGTSSHF